MLKLFPADNADIFADKRRLFLRILRPDQRTSAGKIQTNTRPDFLLDTKIAILIGTPEDKFIFSN
jgi:hypothetical protein